MRTRGNVVIRARCRLKNQVATKMVVLVRFKIVNKKLKLGAGVVVPQAAKMTVKQTCQRVLSRRAMVPLAKPHGYGWSSSSAFVLNDECSFVGLVHGTHPNCRQTTTIGSKKIQR